MKVQRHAYSSVFGLLVIGALFILGSELTNANRVSWGLKLAGEPIGGVTLEELDETLRRMEEKLQKREITIVPKNASSSTEEVLRAHPDELGISLAREALASRLTGIGRETNPVMGFAHQLKALLRFTDVPFEFSYNDEVLTAYLAKHFPALENPARNATLVFNSERNAFLVTREKKGHVVNREKLKSDVNEKLAFGGPLALILEEKEDVPQIISLEVGKAREEAERILAQGPWRLKFENTEWEVEKEDLVSWLHFFPAEVEGNTILDVELSRENIAEYLTPLSTGLNRQPVNAVFAMKDGRVTVFSLSKEGVEVIIDTSAERIKNAIEKEETEKTIVLEKRTTGPEITSERINDLGITALLAVGESNFKGSPKNRTHNIKVGAGRFHGVLIKPGEEFSFNKILGPVDANAGYLAELVIKKDKTVPEYGGGLCQVSTTLFRAAIRAGFEITERFPHAFAVKYYSPQGFDATIYPPHPDIRFKNDSPSHVLIQTRIEGTILFFEFYGTDDGRIVEVSDPVQYDIKKDGAMKAKFDYKVTRDGEVIRERTFFSTYKSPLLYPIQRNPLE